ASRRAPPLRRDRQARAYPPAARTPPRSSIPAHPVEDASVAGFTSRGPVGAVAGGTGPRSPVYPPAPRRQTGGYRSTASVPAAILPASDGNSAEEGWRGWNRVSRRLDLGAEPERRRDRLD